MKNTKAFSLISIFDCWFLCNDGWFFENQGYSVHPASSCSTVLWLLNAAYKSTHGFHRTGFNLHRKWHQASGVTYSIIIRNAGRNSVLIGTKKLYMISGKTWYSKEIMIRSYLRSPLATIIRKKWRKFFLQTLKFGDRGSNLPASAWM